MWPGSPGRATGIAGLPLRKQGRPRPLLAVLAVFCSELSASNASSGAEIRGITHASICHCFAVIRCFAGCYPHFLSEKDETDPRAAHYQSDNAAKLTYYSEFVKLGSGLCQSDRPVTHYTPSDAARCTSKQAVGAHTHCLKDQRHAMSDMMLSA